MRLSYFQIRYFFSIDLLKKIIFLSVLIAIFGTFSYQNMIHQSMNQNITALPNVIEGMIDISSNNFFPVLLFFILILFSSVTVYRCFQANDMYILRLDNKKKYLENVLKTIFITNTVTYLIILVVLFLVLFCFLGPQFSILYVAQYKTYNIIYLFFYLFRSFCLVQVISMITILLFQLLKPSFVLILNIILYIGTMNFYYDQHEINSIWQIPLGLMQYFTTTKYASFYFEVMLSSMYVLFFIMLGGLLFEYCYRHMKRVGD